jgi:septum formation protein
MDEASEFLRMFSDATHTVITAVAFSTPTSAPEVHIVESSVTFLPLTPATIRKYFSRVDPMDKAGAYDIDQCGDMIIRSYAGSRTNIMGLPKELVERWLRDQRLL